MKKKVVLKRIFHREKWRIAILFEYDARLKEIVRSISGSAFSGTNRCFYVDDSEDNLRIVLKMLKDDADVDISQIVNQGDEELKKLEPEEIKQEEIRQEEVEPEYHDYRNFGPVEFRISEKEGLLVIKFLGRYDREWIDEMMTVTVPGQGSRISRCLSSSSGISVRRNHRILLRMRSRGSFTTLS